MTGKISQATHRWQGLYVACSAVQDSRHTVVCRLSYMQLSFTQHQKP